MKRLEITPENEALLVAFLAYVDNSTYIKDGNDRYYESDDQPVTAEELAFMFLDSDLNR